MSTVLVIALNLVFTLLAAVPVLGMALRATWDESRSSRLTVHPHSVRSRRPSSTRSGAPLPAAPASMR